MIWSEVQFREMGRGEGVLMGKVYMIGKWWEVKDWGETLCELMV